MKLGVNIDHVTTLRQARGTVYPDPLDAAILCARAGAHGITAHLREDRRHIQDDDIFRLKELQPLPLNLEMANDESIVEIALNVKPAEVCLVPEKRQELTTEGGLDVVAHFDALKPTVRCLSDAGIEVSMFVDADEATLDDCKDLGAPVVELNTVRSASRLTPATVSISKTLAASSAFRISTRSTLAIASFAARFSMGWKTPSRKCSKPCRSMIRNE